MDHHHHHYHHRHGHQHGHASLYTGRRPHLQFPPPPPYPPPEAAGGVLIPGMPAVPQAPPSNASAHPRRLPPPMHHNDCPYSYSYAYYEPGAMALADRQARHTYVTRYGTEENIYEEIGEVSAKRQAALEEEVRCVQSRHRRVLGELNLTVEAMLMPQPEAPPAPDLLEDLLRSVGPTDELLSPQTDTIHRRAPPPPPAAPPPTPSPSGQAVVAVQINHRQHRSLDLGSNGKPLAPTPIGTGSRDGFWSRKNWRKIPGFHASSGKLNDEPRMRSGSWDDGRHHVANRTVSSEDSYCSASDRELSSDEESDKGTRSNGHLSATLSKAKKLCENFRTATTSSAASTASSPGEAPASTSANHIQQGRLLRWFSIRRNSNYEVETGTPLTGNSPGSTGTMDRSSDRSSDRKMPLLPELEEDGGLAGVNCVFPRRQVPPSLPPPPANLTAQQLKRRHIVAAIVHSENSYVATLQRLVNDFKKPLEESQPPILSSQKIQTLFHRLPEILQCHTLFRIALAESVRSWDKEERLGDVFVASFSKAIVLDIYSGFINNFSVAMELAKQEAKRKSALADFFKVQQISSHDRLSFFGLMVKPVQRFPQFILFLQDLLKHTPQGHPDRMSLQLALTQLESLAEMLNERKREAEQFQAFKEMLRLVSGKFSARPLTASDRSRCLLREDNVQQLEFNGQGLISKSKARRLLLLNDLLVCVAVSPSQRLSLKWNCPVTDIEVVDNSTSPTLSRLLTAGQSKGSSLKSTGSSGENSASGQGAENLCAEMGDLMHDFEVVSRIQELAATLKGNYQELSVDVTRGILSGIQSQIQQRDEEMAWLDSCCLQLKKRDELLTFQMESPAAKQDWITELRLAQLALDSNNSPAWEVPEQERRPSTKMPLFVHARPVQRLNSGNHSEVRCGCYYTVSASKTSLRSVRGPARRSGRSRTSSYLWVCTTDGSNSHIAIMTVGVGRELGLRDAGLRDVASIKLLETNVTAMEFVRGNVSTNSNPDTVWVGTDNHKLILYTATEAESPEEVGSVAVPAGVCHIRGHCDNVFVALSSGSVLMMRRVVGNSAGGVAGWAISDPQEVSLGVDPVACLLAINLCLYAACGNKVFVLSALTGEIQKSFVVAHGGGSVNLIAHSGIGLWISLVGSSTICLYHTETFKHLQDINIASNVVRVTTGAGCSACDGCVRNDCANNNSRLNTSNLSNGGGGSGGAVSVTALLAGRGLLWVGTNVGIALTIPLPRLEGVPIISGRVNISFHAHFGPITFLLALQPRPVRSTWHQSHPSEVDDEDQAIEALPASPLTKEDVETNESLAEPTEADTTEERRRKDAARLRHQLTSSSSPVVLRRRPNKQASSEVAYRRASKTLPRGLGMFSTSTTSSQGSGDTCDVYGLYGELMYVKDYEGEETVADPAYESLRRSDPELAAIPGKVSTLDRQLRLKASRPRSLDLSNWSVDSRTSSLYTSSGSEGSRPVSRQNSAAGDAAAPSGTVSINASPSSSTVVEPPGKPAKAKGKERSVEGSRRTVITIMGGRGYVNWRQSCCPSSNDRRRSSNATAVNKEPNSNDAHLVVWEMKL